MVNDSSRKRLGRGLAALIGDLDQPVKSTPEKPVVVEPAKGSQMVPIEWIRANPNNPRRHFAESELADLSGSIREHGLVQPILVRPVKDTSDGVRYEIIAGERRWRAAQNAALHEIPIISRDVEDKQALELAIIENVQRADLNAIEEAFGYQQLIDEHDYTQNELARVISKSRSHVANTLRLLKLPIQVQGLVSNGDLSAGHARTLVTADNPEALAKRIVSEGLSVRQAEMIAQSSAEAQTGKPSRAKGESDKSADIQALEKQLENALGLKIDLRHGARSNGELRIKYRSLDQLDELCRLLGAGR